MDIPKQISAARVAAKTARKFIEDANIERSDDNFGWNIIEDLKERLKSVICTMNTATKHFKSKT